MGSGSKGLYSGAYGSRSFPGSIDFMKKGDEFSEYIRKRRDVDANGFYDVIGHGGSRIMKVEHNGTQVPITHRALARLLKNDRRIAGQAIRLLSCNTGKISHGFAQGLADRLGVPVRAPSDYLWARTDGTYFVAGGKIVNEKLEPDYSKPGRFITYKPHGRKKK